MMLRFDDQGAGTSVVLIHGFPLSRQMWHPQSKVLTDAGFRVVCPDLPGFGKSPAIERASMSAYADAVIALMDDLGIDKAVVGGMSMGGYVLLNLVQRYPERLLGAMFLLTRAAADDAAGKAKRTALADEVGRGNHVIVSETFAQVLFAPDTVQQKPELVSEVRQWMESTSAAGLIGGLRAMRDREDFVARLAGVNLPALVVGAEQDLAVPVEHAHILAEGLPNATLKVIPEAGHMANLEQSESFSQALLEFLATLGD